MSSTKKEIEFLTFDVNGTICGMNLLDIQEIKKASNIAIHSYYETIFGG